uniref:Protein kinase domain-containing protein n=1 Tax=Euplotes harpa TaxID=151035 RepID=A0A7S3JKZ7_9SPIT|mmetsp:Transcript_7063/g.8010  ORF Transcript_7063/g.8010 Transcript_7063/m.8010 type:complete len:170 (+) Transcript_7063:692-1201(+)
MWAFGVILYQCLTGELPFTGSTIKNNVYQIEMNICNQNIDFSKLRVNKNNSDIVDLLDLIKRLLVKNPLHRLGGGEEGTKYNIDKLKKHPFFDKYSFRKVYQLTPPVSLLGLDTIEIARKFRNLDFVDQPQNQRFRNHNSYKSTKHTTFIMSESDESDDDTGFPTEMRR